MSLLGTLSGTLFTSDQMEQARLSVCYGCDRFEPKFARCLDCGCFLKAKAKLRGADCPQGKWPKENT